MSTRRSTPRASASLPTARPSTSPPRSCRMTKWATASESGSANHAFADDALDDKAVLADRPACGRVHAGAEARARRLESGARKPGHLGAQSGIAGKLQGEGDVLRERQRQAARGASRLGVAQDPDGGWLGVRLDH